MRSSRSVAVALCRGYASSATAGAGSMSAWQVEAFGDELKLRTVPVPRINKPNDVLLRVQAASVNPIDTVMRRGYGNEVLSTWKQVDACSLSPTTRLPLTPGRDCAAVVEAVGGSVKSVKPGDEVIAVIPAIESGSHAQFVVTKDHACVRRPANLDPVSATALPYVASTAWAALVSVARIDPKNAREQRVLIHGGAGGVGSTAIQLLKAWGAAKIVATCSADSFDLVRSLGAIPIDYRGPKATDELIEQAPFEVILDCVDSPLARWSDNVMGIWRNCVHVSVVSPLLSDTDRYGIPIGLASTAARHFERSFQSALNGRWFSYAFFAPSEECLKQLAEHLEAGRVKPIIDKVFAFAEMPQAYEKVAKLNGRGKTVVKF